MPAPCARSASRGCGAALLPDLPTFDESGLKDFEVESWAGLFAPAGTPAEIVRRLNAETRRIIENPQVKAQIAQIGFEVFGSTPEELGEFVKVQLVRTSGMVGDAGIEREFARPDGVARIRIIPGGMARGGRSAMACGGTTGLDPQIP
jgi:tripartite-type tricarboxylate transporter receptor subunit TctC